MKIQFLSFTGLIAAFVMLPYLVSDPFTNSSISTPEIANAIEESTSVSHYVDMPIGHEQWTRGEFEDFIDNLTPEMESELIKSHHVKSYLKEINKYDAVLKDMAKGSLFSEVELSKYLTEKQIADMSYFKFVEAKNSTAPNCQNTMVSCRSAGTACTSTTRYIQKWWSCTWCYYYEICRSSCGGPY